VRSKKFLKMDLKDRVKDYILNAREFDPQLALEIVEFQLHNNPLYRRFFDVNGVSRVSRIEDLPFFPVEYFKHYEIIIGEPTGYFESSGTTGKRSKVFYHKDSLELYEASALRSFPFIPHKILSLVPSFDIANNSSLAYMIKIFEKRFNVSYIKDSYELSDIERVLDHLERAGENSLVFLTSTQLLKLCEFMKEKNVKIEKRLTFVETGGYKALRKRYVRWELYTMARDSFPEGDFHSEYGMSELFSQFYTVCRGMYRMSPYARVFTQGKGFLKVFDFANLFTISALLVPDMVVVEGECFDVLGRGVEDEKGCAFTFR